MKAKGVAIVEGDLMKPETLLQVCEGVDVVVSAVGNNEVTVPGQKNLIDAAKQQGVKLKRFSNALINSFFVPKGRETEFLEA